MKIELGEDNGFLNNGEPTMVVVTVTTDDGKKIRFPYDACGKTISALFKDVRSSCQDAPVLKEQEIIASNGMAVLKRDVLKDKEIIVADPNKIEREDIVRCIVLEKRESSCDLKIGGEYRILKVFKKDIPTGPDGKMQTVYDGYDVIDDTSANPIRTYVFAHEVSLSRKRVPPPVKTSTFEEMIKCGFCDEINAIPLNKEMNKYLGDCSKCGGPIEAERPSVKSSDQKTK